MIDYKDAGVDLALAGKIPLLIKEILKEKGLKNKSIGDFSAVLKLDRKRYISLSSDGVGTKVFLAEKLKKFDTLGIDLVAMNINDILCSGLKPVYFLDYIGFGQLTEKCFREIFTGIIDGCKEAEVDLVGGETAQMAELYHNRFDLAGFSMGIGEKADLFKQNLIKNKDLIIGIPSSGIHSNGFSLVNKLIKNEKLKPTIDLLTPTKIYVKEIKKLRKKIDFKGLAHITGGGILENIKRVIPKNYSIKLYYNWKIPEVFKRIQASGVNKDEMFRVFNMGIGMAFVISKSQLKNLPTKYQIIGEIV